jgi:hypothetical protein
VREKAKGEAREKEKGRNEEHGRHTNVCRIGVPEAYSGRY